MTGTLWISSGGTTFSTTPRARRAGPASSTVPATAKGTINVILIDSNGENNQVVTNWMRTKVMDCGDNASVQVVGAKHALVLC